MKKILVAVDGSDCSLKAVEYCGEMFKGDDFSFTLFHVLPYVPPEIWDIGHILSDKEETERQAFIQKWLDSRIHQVEPIFQKGTGMLLRANVREDNIETKVVSDSTDVAGSILEEARNGHYTTLVLGRCGSTGGIREFLLGSTTSRIINRGAGLAICVVE